MTLIKIILISLLIPTLSSCNQEWKEWINLFNLWKYEKASNVFEILKTKNNNEEVAYNFATSLYKNWEYDAAYEQFIEIQNTPFSKKQSIEYQLWNTSYKVWENKESIKDRINYYIEAIEYYNFWLMKNPSKDLKEKFEENIEFVKKKIEQEEKKKEIMDNLKWTKDSKSSEWKSGKSNHTNKDTAWLIKEIKKLQKDEIKLQNHFNRFWNDDFRLKWDPNEIELEYIENVLDENFEEEYEQSGERDW